MKSSKFALLFLGSVVAVSMATGATPSPGGAYKPPLNVYGQPDLEGTWTNASLTELERSKEFGTRKTLTDAEVKKIEGEDAKAVAEGNAPTDPMLKTTDLPHDCGRGFSGAGCGYNVAWIDPGSTVMRVNGEPRSSFLTDPADGRLPALKAGVVLPLPYQHRGENPENMTLAERCLTSFGYSAGPIMLPLLYNNNYEIAQSKDTVAIVVEMVHDVR